MLFSVRCYKGPTKPQGGYQAVEAGDAKEAAEKLCGEPLTERGNRSRLRAMVHTNPPGGLPLTFYAIVKGQ